MSTKVQTGPGPLDTVKLLLAALVLIGGIVAYYYFEDESILLRAAGVLVSRCSLPRDGSCGALFRVHE